MSRSHPDARRAHVLLALLAVPLMLSVSCGEDTPVTSVDRETFITTYVELRRAALAVPGGRISPERRHEILAARGVTEEDLIAFAEAWGRDVDAMAGIWTDVEQRLTEQDSAAADQVP